MPDAPHVIVIGAGFTGCALAYDLAQRGLRVTVVERGDIAYGTSGRTHGLLHSGGRYCVVDRESAVECITENRVLRRIAPEVIEPNGGLFVALDEADLAYAPRFEEGAAACDIDIRPLTPKQALELEPNLNPNLLAAYWVPDGTFDPLRLALAFAASARRLGAAFNVYCDVTGLAQDGTGRVVGVQIADRVRGTSAVLGADLVVSATGAWAGQVAAMAGLDVPVKPTPGVMVAFTGRFTQRAINRLCEPDDGDILVPQRRMVVVGTTSFEVQDLDYIPIEADQVAMMVERGSALVPALAGAPWRGSYMSSRPLVGGGVDARSIARTFKCIDHAQTEGLEGLITITGGKATTCRVMAEKTANVVCARLGFGAPCRTAEAPLLPYREFFA